MLYFGKEEIDKTGRETRAKTSNLKQAKEAKIT